MYVIAGATGRVGSAVTRHLLDAGAEVRVIVRRRADAEHWQAQGAEARIAVLEDRAAVSEALEGSTGFFALLPFDLTVTDVDAHADTLITSIAGAVADQQVPHVVMLSSAGADRAEGTGPITGLHRLEQALLSTGTVLTALRSGHFQEKVSDVIDVARDSGIYPVFATSADVPLPMVATRDIGALAAQCLLAPSAASEVVDVIGPGYSERTVATLLGRALGRELETVVIPESAWTQTLADAGFSPHIAEQLAELYRADAQGLLAPRGDRRARVTTGLGTTISHLLEPSAAARP